ncbi:MAG: hemolysin family protein [Saprospiraceae bacterium]|nr:hemolysin family protein [Saprospiraceae bacterium]
MALSFFIVLFLLLSALFSGSEIAFVSANKLRVELKKKKGVRRGGILAHFYDYPASFLSTMLVGNNIALVVFTFLMTKLLDPYVSQWFGADFLLLFANTIIITVIVLIFGEFLPKTLCRLYADDVLYILAYPLRFLQILLYIPSWIMTRLSERLLSLVTLVPPETTETVFTRLDLERFIIDSPEHEEEIDRELFGKALNLKEVRVRECMVPRPEIENIDIRASVAELEQLFNETKLSRLIVTEDDIDNVLGYVHHQQMLKSPRSIEPLVMEISFVPEVMRVTDLLSRFIKERISIACVVDEFGGVAGIITLEDILEEIFGEIEDEHDQEEYVETRISENEYIFSGRLEIDYLNEKYPELNFPEGEYHTLSGYLVMTTQEIPEQGGIIILNGYKYVLELVSDTKIETIRVVRMSEE